MKDEVEKSNEQSFKFLILDCIINGKQKASNKFENTKKASQLAEMKWISENRIIDGNFNSKIWRIN